MSQNPNALSGPKEVEEPSAPGDIDITAAAPEAETPDDGAPDKRRVVGPHAATIVTDFVLELHQGEETPWAA